MIQTTLKLEKIVSQAIREIFRISRELILVARIRLNEIFRENII